MSSDDPFVRHEPCPSCGSRDNLARYKSGSASCFGCGYYERSKVSLFVLEDKKIPITKNIILPDDVCMEYSKEAVEWVSKYGISIPELLKHNVMYSPGWKQLIFTFYGEGLVLWQARNLDPVLASRKKYYTQGDVEHTLPIYKHSQSCRKLVIVEDCLSAIKIARHFDAMPALSSDISREKLARLKYLYDEIVVWLDGNMFNKAIKLSKAAQMLGFESRAVWTHRDPKEYNDEFLVEELA